MRPGSTLVKRWEISGKYSKRHRLDVGVLAYYFCGFGHSETHSLLVTCLSEVGEMFP